MSLSDYDDELKYTDEMTKAHQYRDKHMIYCVNCHTWIHKLGHHTCNFEKFKKELIGYLIHGVKEGYIEEEFADEILNEWDIAHQIEWYSFVSSREELKDET